MNIAKLENGTITVGHYRDLFPNTSFPISGPNDDFFTENNCLKVSVFKTHNRDTEMLVGCEPYEENGVIYTVEVQTRPDPVETIEVSVGGDSV